MIGQNIKRLRELKGWSQETLARKMGYKSKSTINKIESNVNDVNQTTLNKFAEVFKCDPVEIIGVPGHTETLSVYTPAMPTYDFNNDKVEKAKALYKEFESLTPEKQAALLNYLKFLQTDSELPHLI